ncbi:acyl-CoA dehydrogenase family protein [Gulosibacter chungangensis]|uniref:acyl-CoA dehydrogenase family protein n=1 Tax=Gulosibacter chungangensis TaxID=979746 RepID=UPI001CE4A58C|nr:acyl-CoA dehydrogenase family protein [Gulosibacter chungangensis]
MSAPFLTTSGALFTLDQEHLEIREEARAVAASVAQYAAEADELDVVHRPMAQAVKASGLTRYVIPAAYGGANETLDPLAIAIVREEFAAVSAHLDSLYGMQGVGSYAITVGGSDALRAEWLPKVLSLDAIAAIALTEVEIGSDLRSVSTELREEGDEIVITGEKSFITNAPEAAFFCVLGREGDGYSMAFVPADTPGVTVTSGPDLIAPHIIGGVTFDEVRVPKENRLGETGKAFSLMLQVLAVFRATVAGASLGIGRAALEEALKHTQTREQFGKPLLNLGAVSQKLALSWAELEAARALTYSAAAQAAAAPLAHIAETSMAKVVATETAGRVADRAVQSMGRFGLVRGSDIERHYRNSRPGRIYEGSTEVLLDSLARQLSKRTKAALENGGGIL